MLSERASQKRASRERKNERKCEQTVHPGRNLLQVDFKNWTFDRDVSHVGADSVGSSP